MIKINNFFSGLRSLSLYSLSQKYNKIYLCLVTTFSLLGYAYLLFFPTLVIVGVLYFSTLIDSVLYDQTYTIISILAASVVLSAIMTYFICTIKFPSPKGLCLPPQKYPHLAALIDSAEKQAVGLKIHSVKLTESFELAVQKTPIVGFPFWSRNTLILGFTYMQSMPPIHFKSMLHRKIRQFGKSHLITSWVYRTEQIWTQFPSAIKSNTRIGEQFVYWFFVLYAPLFRRLALYAIQSDELLADIDTLEHVNSEDYLVAIELELSTKNYIQQQFWPGMMAIVKKRQRKPATLKPYSKLPSAIANGISNNKLQTYLQKRYSVAVNRRTLNPPLKVRMDHIGHQKLQQLPISKVNAAQYIFGKDYPKIVLYMDNQWTNKMNSAVLKIIKKASSKLRLVEAAA